MLARALLATTLAVAAWPPRPALAQQVWVVDFQLGAGADFAEVQPAIDAASDGDVVLVRVGPYPGFTIDGKGVTVSVYPHTLPTFVPARCTTPVRVVGVPPGSQVVLRELSLTGEDATPDSALVVDDCFGPVWVEGCEIGAELAGSGARDGVRATDSVAVVLERCEVRGAQPGLFAPVGPGGSALRVVDSLVVSHDTTFRGADGSSYSSATGRSPFAGGAGVVVHGGQATLAGGSATGGSGGTSLGTEFTAACVDPGPGGPGAELVGTGSALRAIGVELVGGAGGLVFGTPCPTTTVPGPAGAPLENPAGTVELLPGPTRSLLTTSPVREGDTFRALLLGEPGELAVLALDGVAAPLYAPALGGQLLVPLSARLIVVGFVDGSGAAVWTATVPELGPTTGAVPLVWQGLFLDLAGPLAAGAGSATVLVDAGT